MFCYNSPVGKIYIEEENNHIVKISFFKLTGEEKETALIKETCRQLSEYFEGERKTFCLPVAPKGTEFQKKVWRALCSITDKPALIKI